MKFRKKPVVIEATQWDETLKTLKTIGCKHMSCSGNINHPNVCTDLRIETLEGIMRVGKGDWIIKGVQDEYYPCKPDIFDATYEKAG